MSILANFLELNKALEQQRDWERKQQQVNN